MLDMAPFAALRVTGGPFYKTFHTLSAPARRFLSTSTFS